MLSQPYDPPIADAQSLKAPGTVANDNADGLGEAWSNPSNAKASDNSYATRLFDNPLKRSYSQLLKATGHAFPIPESASVVGVLGIVEASCAGGSAIEELTITEAFLSIGGVIFDEEVGYLGSNVVPPLGARGALTLSTSDRVFSIGGSSNLWGFPSLTPAIVNASGFGFGIRVSGRCTERTARIDRMGLGIFYAEAEAEDRVCFAGRGIELASDGAARQTRSDDVWGPAVPDGFLPFDTPGGSEGKPSRGILIPTTGDLEELPESGSPTPLSAVVKTRAGHLYARGGGS